MEKSLQEASKASEIGRNPDILYLAGPRIMLIELVA